MLLRRYLAFPPFDLLRPVVSPGPPFSVVFTDWLSITRALGEAYRPSRSRSHRARAWTAFSHTPSFYHLRK
jgi:hypothetical protein